MVYDPNHKPKNPYASTYANFLEQTKDHVLTVTVDEGMNRQMRVGNPAYGTWSWRVATWPGYLATYGDIADGFMFTREEDMIRFFAGSSQNYYSDGAPSIDFRYWAEKICGGRYHSLFEYSAEAFMEHVKTVLEENDEIGTEIQAEYDKIVEVTKRVCSRHGVDYDKYLAAQRAGDHRFLSLEIDPDDDERTYFGEDIDVESPAQRRENLLQRAKAYSDSDSEAREWLRDNEEVMGSDDYWEADLKEFNVHFLFACYAIELTVRLWREYEQTPEAIAHRNPGDSYILVEGGLVQNNPSLPVFDLDILDSDNDVKDVADELVNLYERINAHPQARVDYEATLTHIAAVVRAEARPEFVEEINDLEAKRLNTKTKE